MTAPTATAAEMQERARKLWNELADPKYENGHIAIAAGFARAKIAAALADVQQSAQREERERCKQVALGYVHKGGFEYGASRVAHNVSTGIAAAILEEKS